MFLTFNSVLNLFSHILFSICHFLASLASTCQISRDAKALASFCVSLETRVSASGGGRVAGGRMKASSGTSGSTDASEHISFVVKAFRMVRSQADDAIFEGVRSQVMQTTELAP